MSSANGALKTALETHPDKRSITILGEKHDFLLGMWGLRLAEKKGQKVEFSAGDEVDLESTAKVIYAGLLPFDPDLDYDLLTAQLSMNELVRLGEELQKDIKRVSDDLQLDKGEPGGK